MNELILDIEETIELLKPKIKKELKQTSYAHKEDLEQEIFLMIIKTIKEKKFKKPPIFLDLLNQENDFLKETEIY